MTGISDIKIRNFVEIFMPGNFGAKVCKSKIGITCIALFIRVSEDLKQTYASLANKRSFLLKNELSKLPLIYQENSHFFLRKTISKTHRNLLSIFRIAFTGSEVYFIMEKEHHIFGLNVCEISQRFTEKNDTSFYKKHYEKLTRESCENIELLF